MQEQWSTSLLHGASDWSCRQKRSISMARITAASALIWPLPCGARSTARISARPAGVRQRSRSRSPSCSGSVRASGCWTSVAARRAVPGAGRAYWLFRCGLDIEAAGIAHAQSVASARGLADRATFLALDCGGGLPFPRRRLRRSPLGRCDQSSARSPWHADEWARLLRPGGRLLFTDALVVTGPVSKPEIDIRASLGFYLFVPPGVNEAAVAAAGLCY